MGRLVTIITDSGNVPPYMKRADHFGNITYEKSRFSALRHVSHPNEKSADAETRSRDFRGESLASINTFTDR